MYATNSQDEANKTLPTQRKQTNKQTNKHPPAKTNILFVNGRNFIINWNLPAQDMMAQTLMVTLSQGWMVLICLNE